MRTSIPKTEAIFSEDPISSTYHQPGHRNLTGNSLLGFPIAFFWMGRDDGSELFIRSIRREICRGNAETGKWRDGVIATSNRMRFGTCESSYLGTNLDAGVSLAGQRDSWRLTGWRKDLIKHSFHI